MTHLSLEDLEGLAFGELDAERARALEPHLAGCDECSREPAWLRAERTLLARRPALPTAHLWAGVEARLSHPRRRPRWAWRVAVAAAGAAAAAAVLLVVYHPAPSPLPAQEPQAARKPSRPAISLCWTENPAGPA